MWKTMTNTTEPDWSRHSKKLPKLSIKFLSKVSISLAKNRKKRTIDKMMGEDDTSLWCDEWWKS